MLKRLILRIIHFLATRVLSLLEVAGIPRVPQEGKGEGKP